MVDGGDGTTTMEGSAVTPVDESMFNVSSPPAIDNDDGSFTVSS